MRGPDEELDVGEYVPQLHGGRQIAHEVEAALKVGLHDAQLFGGRERPLTLWSLTQQLH
jgi:hypothetical protein